MKWTYTTPDFRKVNVKSFTKVYSTNTVGIYDINRDKRFVLKVIKSPKLMPQFHQELKYGTLKNVLKNEQIRVHAFALHGRLGAYVMDHVSFGDKGVESMTADEYMNSELFDKKSFSEKFYQSLKKFYKTFGGFHGDLHAENVMVNVRKTGLLKNVVIIDYANIQPFRRMTTKVLNDVHSAFMKIRSEDTIEEHPPGSGIPVKWVSGGIPVRSNKNMLGKLGEWRRLK